MKKIYYSRRLVSLRSKQEKTISERSACVLDIWSFKDLRTDFVAKVKIDFQFVGEHETF